MTHAGHPKRQIIFITLAILSLLNWSLPLSSVKAQEAKSVTASASSHSFPAQDELQSGQRIFSNSAAISIPGVAGQTSGTAAPYPSNITISGFSGKIVDVNVQLNSITHTHPDDLDIMLVSPTGQSVVLMSDAGNGDDLSSAYVAFDDSAPTMLPDSSLIAGNQAYRPTNYETGEVLPAPAPAFSGETPLSVFDGTSPNGTWSLYVFDDASQDAGSIGLGWSLSIAVSSPGAPNVMDFDGDGRSDYAVVRDTGGTLNWYLLQSTAGFKGQAFGSTGDTVVPGDYDGDGRWDVAVWRPGAQSYFYIWRSSNGSIQAIPFGVASDDARITQDFDGDGITDPAVTRNVGGTLVWYIQRSALGFTAVSFGNDSDVGIRGDYDGDGKADISVYRKNSGNPANTFFILRSLSGTMQSVQFGNYGTDFILPADFDGDNKTDIAVWRASTGAWYWLQSSDGAFRALQFGSGGDVPAPGDYDRDGKTDQVVWRAGSPAVFYINHSVLGEFEAVQFGTTGDITPAFTLQAR